MKTEHVNWSTIAAVVSAAFAIVSALVATAAWWPFGEARPIEPSAYAIRRGVDLSPSRFPSDHLVVPLEWENDKGRPVLIRQPELILYELDNSEETGTQHRFLLAGEYTDISPEAFSRPYARRNSLVLDPHSVSLHALIFHIEGWWDSNTQAHYFQFAKNKEYKVEIRYQTDSEKSWQEMELLKKLPIYESVENLDLYGEDGTGWDYWELRE